MVTVRRGCSRVAVYRHAGGGGGRDQIEVPASLNKSLWATYLGLEDDWLLCSYSYFLK